MIVLDRGQRRCAMCGLRDRHCQCRSDSTLMSSLTALEPPVGNGAYHNHAAPRLDQLDNVPLDESPDAEVELTPAWGRRGRKTE